LASLFLSAAKQFGPVVTVVVILVILAINITNKITNLINKIDKRVGSLEEEMETVGSTCDDRKTSFKKIYDRLDGLESKDLTIDGSLRVIDTKLNSQSDQIGSIGKNVETILKHFAQKGMDA
jgi:hypothetical protein